MKKLLTTNTSASVGFSAKTGVWNHLQNAYTELSVNLAKTIVGEEYSTSVPYALYGCANSGSGSNYVISAGIILYNNALYLMPAATFSTSGPNVAICTITTSYATGSDADPVQHSDGNSYNILEDKTVVVSSGTSGTFNYSDLIQINSKINLSLNANYSYTQQGNVRKNRDGQLSFEGILVGGASANTMDVLFTLPVGYRPSITVTQAINLYKAGSPYFQAANITFAPSGAVQIILTAAFPTTSLNGWYVMMNSITPFNIK